jgi:LDH2 family malate/lactate/ureidoglycolate dehydrogenase
MDDNHDSEKMKVPYEELKEIGILALEKVGVPLEEARATVEILLCADLRGVSSHGVQRLLMYVPKIRKGLMNPRPKIEVRSLAPGLRLVSGDDGLGPVVGTRGMREAIDLAKTSGIGFVGCSNSNHFSAAAPYVLMACQEKLIGIAGTNAFPTMPPWGGLGNIIGNNPLAIGVPCEGTHPFVLDMATSVSSRGRMRDMAKKNEKMPEGWAVDKQGKPTTDPLVGLKGYVLPMGEHKGYGLSIAIDIIAGVLTGSGFATGVKSLLQQWEEPQHVGHFFIVIDPVRFMPWEEFSDRLKALFLILRGSQRINPDKAILIPGDYEDELEKTRRASGIPIDRMTLNLLRGLIQGQYDYEIPKF